ncbi:uncharacterized protein I303_102550 [Kwoniella dejecticola CBS 10117]|uniref:Uncharacterized protein n=1 Tax=Kwoniella dejecticola CBS 10117 TaxID=1296121 RepID=A0A1A6A924_9TREE|nr:uncharacterized protein I303_02564 [Kwoniella dejecticola CBS 10117]OBR86556.1 hypothetical protein I303_02564 [Kwoniella dejecticola CBS 10117]
MSSRDTRSSGAMTDGADGGAPFPKWIVTIDGKSTIVGGGTTRTPSRCQGLSFWPERTGVIALYQEHDVGLVPEYLPDGHDGQVAFAAVTVRRVGSIGMQSLIPQWEVTVNGRSLPIGGGTRSYYTDHRGFAFRPEAEGVTALYTDHEEGQVERLLAEGEHDDVAFCSIRVRRVGGDQIPHSDDGDGTDRLKADDSQVEMVSAEARPTVK